MSSSTDWRQNNNWRMGFPLTDRRDENPTPSPGVVHTPRGWLNADSTTKTHQRGHRRPPDRPRQAVAQPGSSKSVDTVAEGRRIYLGNLLYRINPSKIEDMLATEGFGDEVENVHISVDAVNGRNPGYCFIDFKTRNGAQTALESLAGTLIQGRPVKVGPCQPKRAGTAGKSDGYTPTFQRWGDWKGSRPGGLAERCPGEGIEQGPYGALDHIDAVSKGDAPARVFIGGLGKMINQRENDKEIRAYFDGFNAVAISKRITPPPSARQRPGNRHYCFVDFESPEEAAKAIRAIDGRVTFGGKLRVRVARGLPPSAVA